jgi:hypothetical protein
MAKQKRLGARPGQRRPLQRPTTRPATSRPAGSVTPEEEARAAEIEAQILAEEKAADDARRSRDRRATTATQEAAIYSSAPLAERAAVEYAYVRRDLRRLTVVCLSLLGVLALIYVLLNILNVF